MKISDMSHEQLSELLNDTMIEALLEQDAEMYASMSGEALLEMFKYRVCGLRRVDGVWVNPKGDSDD